MNEQIDELECDLRDCHHEFVMDNDVYTDYSGTARNLIDKGWRKQSVGEWRQDFDGDFYCPFCANYPKEIRHYCPNCGAKMKGGEE